MVSTPTSHFTGWKIEKKTERKEARAMRLRVKRVIQVIMCRLNRHEYIVRLACNMTGQNLRNCKYCGKFE